MFENSVSLIPWIWTAANSWFTPTVFFILLNIVIGTIAIISKLSHRHQQFKQDLNPDQQQYPPPPPPLYRSPSSVLQRLRSINFYPYKFNDPEPSSYPSSVSVSDDSNFSLQQQTSSDKFQTLPTDSHHVFHQDQTEEQEEVGSEEAKSMDEVYSQLNCRHVTRTRSDTEPASGEIPAELPAKMRKSATMKSAFGHFNINEDASAVVEVEARRPATARERKTRLGEADLEVDAKADDFINRFKQQLKLQRLDSILRYKEMIGRGAESNITK